MPHDWHERFRDSHPEIDISAGSSANFDFYLESLTLKSGATIPLQRVGVTALVGANNAGKSTVLRETFVALSQNHHYAPARIAVESFDARLEGELPDLIQWLGEHAYFLAAKDGQAPGFHRPNTGRIGVHQFASLIGQPLESLGVLANALVFYGNAQGRFGIGGSTEMRENVDDPPQHPIHHLEDSKKLFDEVSTITDSVFGSALTLDTLSRTLRLRVGTLNLPAPPVNDISREYRDAMGALPPLDEQGDGMKSFLGQLLPTLAASYKVLILDEPEAFLHPPQAHALGVQLGMLAARQQVQLILATHDRNLLTGLLESSVDVSVVRLDRSSGPTQAHTLDADELRALWSDPVLRYTNILDGLFHRLVVVAEAEGDCAFLNAGLDCPGRSLEGLPRHEILFVPTGGKSGIAKVCRALSKIGVRTVAAPDLDILNDLAVLSEVVRSLGHEWTEALDTLRRRATGQFSTPKVATTNRQILETLTSVLGAQPDLVYTSEMKNEVNRQLRAVSPWDDVKTYGTVAFKGDAHPAVIELLTELHSRGVVAVHEGELERLAPEVPAAKGPAWLTAALGLGAQCNDKTQAHLGRILTAGLTPATIPDESIAGTGNCASGPENLRSKDNDQPTNELSPAKEV